MDRRFSKVVSVVERMERLYSAKYGLVNNVYVDERKMNVVTGHYSYIMGNIVPMSGTIVRKSTNKIIAEGSAIALDEKRGKIRAFGEFVERYCGLYNEIESVENCIFDSFNNMQTKGLHCLNLSTLNHFSEEYYKDPEFLFEEYSSASVISWMEGEDIVHGKKTWLPLQKIFLEYPLPKEELLYIPRLSTGLSCGSSYEQAILGGIFEVVERDSFMLTWLLKIPGIRIEMENIRNESLGILYRHILNYLVGEDELLLYDISKTNGIYTILACLRNNLPNAYGLIVSAATHIDPEVAVFKALEEVCQIQNFAYIALVSDEKKNYQNLRREDIDTLHKHSYYYSSGKNNKKMDFISSSKESIRLSDMVDYAKKSHRENLQYMLKLFRQQEQPIYVADVTKAEIRDVGFWVFKVICPSYLDLEINHRFRQFNSSRLQMFQEEDGVKINDEPHPFA